jgi:hypothetical protein
MQEAAWQNGRGKMGIGETGTVNGVKPPTHANDPFPPGLVKQFNEAVNHSAVAENSENTQGSNNTQNSNGETNSQQHADAPASDFAAGNGHDTADEIKDTAVHSSIFMAGVINLWNTRMSFTAVGQGFRSAPLGMQIDEMRAVANGGSWADPRNKQFLDQFTNMFTKNAGIASHQIPARAQISLAEELAKGPEAFRAAANQLVVRNFGEVKELEAITNKAVAGMKNLNRSPRELADAVNKSIRGFITRAGAGSRAATEEASLVARGLREIGVDTKTMTFLKHQSHVAEVAAETGQLGKTGGTLASVAAKAAPWLDKAGKVLAPAGQVLGKVATPVAFLGAGVQWATAKTTDDYVDAGMSTASATLMAAPHPVAKAAGAGIAAGQLIEQTMDVSDYSSAIGIKTKEFGERIGAGETASFVAGGIATVASTPSSITIAAADKITGGRFARWIGLK